MTTFGEKVIDVFYVTDLVGHQVTNGARQNRIRKKLLALFGEGDITTAQPQRHNILMSAE